MIPFACPTCKAPLQANDAEAGTTYACPQCGQRTLVPSLSPANKNVFGELSIPPRPEAIQQAPPQSLMPPPSARLWYYEIAGRKCGPVPEEEMHDLIRGGDLRPADPVWSKGMSDWRDAERCFDFPDDDYDYRPIIRRPAPASNAAHTCSILSCIFGGISFLFCPILLGLTGIILGVVGASQSQNKTLGIIGIVLSATGMVVGVLIGIWVATALQMRF
jgi:DNA-directed RNA polymerase subunit RPC12/RpoP